MDQTTDAQSVFVPSDALLRWVSISLAVLAHVALLWGLMSTGQTPDAAKQHLTWQANLIADAPAPLSPAPLAKPAPASVPQPPTMNIATAAPVAKTPLLPQPTSKPPPQKNLDAQAAPAKETAQKPAKAAAAPPTLAAEPSSPAPTPPAIRIPEPSQAPMMVSAAGEMASSPASASLPSQSPTPAVPSETAARTPPVAPALEADGRNAEAQPSSDPPITATATAKLQAPAPIAQRADADQLAIALRCPRQQAPQMPSRALRLGIEGSVQADIFIRDGKVHDVAIVSGPRVFHQAVVEAARQYECNLTPTPVRARQTFVFKIN